VNGYLLDTSVALRATTYPERISAHARHAIERGPVFLSVLSYWEVVLKSMKGSLDVGDPRTWWPETVAQLAATILPLRPDHIGEIAELPPLHSDPFDRGLIAQARFEELVLVTNDAHIAKYAGSRLRVLA
jgi:PIN domain nuclease of toxin-antitoxin system